MKKTNVYFILKVPIILSIKTLLLSISSFLFPNFTLYIVSPFLKVYEICSTSIFPTENSYIFSLKSEKIVFETVFSEDENLKAPISLNDRIGVLKVYKDNVLIDEIEVVSLDAVAKKTYFDHIKDIKENWAIAWLL